MNQIEQTTQENLTDMIAGCFKTDSLTEPEIVQICTDCIDIATTSFDFMKIAETIVASRLDFNFAIDVYKRAEAILVDVTDYTLLACSVMEKLHDIDWGLKLIEESQAKAKISPNTFDYMRIADVYANEFGDKIRAREYYLLSEQYASKYDELDLLAKSVMDGLHDTKWYAELKEKANKCEK
jgi:hypothetical protein